MILMYEVFKRNYVENEFNMILEACKKSYPLTHYVIETHKSKDLFRVRVYAPDEDDCIESLQEEIENDL